MAYVSIMRLFLSRRQVHRLMTDIKGLEQRLDGILGSIRSVQQQCVAGEVAKPAFRMLTPSCHFLHRRLAAETEEKKRELERQLERLYTQHKLVGRAELSAFVCTSPVVTAPLSLLPGLQKARGGAPRKSLCAAPAQPPHQVKLQNV